MRFVASTLRFIAQLFRPNLEVFFRERHLSLWAASILVGALAAVASIGFRLMIGLVQLPWLGTVSERTAGVAALTPWPIILFGPALGGLVVGYVCGFLPGRRAGGPAEVIEAEELGADRLRLRVGLLGALASAVTLGSGGSAGREGPVVHLGAAVAAWLARALRLPEAAGGALLCAGVASAIAASFNAPIAGALFALEVVLRRISTAWLPPIVIASSIGAIIGRLAFGEYPAFLLPEHRIQSYWEFPAFALLGAVAAAAAVLFQLAMRGTFWAFHGVTLPSWLKPAVGGLAVGSIGVFFPEILGVGYQTVEIALNGSLDIGLLLTFAVLKVAATALTLGSGGAGGIFSPSLYIGAMIGGAFGIMATTVFPTHASDPAIYAILGMGAVAAAVLGAPVSTTVMVFELTGGYGMSVALLLAVSIASALTRAGIGYSYFRWQLASRASGYRPGG